MMNKGKLLALVMALVLMLAVAATAGAVSSSDLIVSKPSDYDKNVSYPVIYMLPHDGVSTYIDIVDELHSGMDLIVVQPKKLPTSDLHTYMEEVVAYVDSEYSTIKDAKYRALVGSGVGGYLAYAVGMTDEKGDVVDPTTFGFIASTNGNFVNNSYYNQYGDVYKKLSAAGSSKVGKYYTYLDAPVDGQWTNDEGSTNDLGNLLHSLGTSTQEFTVRLGTFTEDFQKESAKRIADRFSVRALSGIVSGSVTLPVSVIKPDTASAKVEYSVKLSKNVGTFTAESLNVVPTVALLENGTNNVLTSKNGSTLKIAANATENGSVTISNKVSGSSSIVSLSATVLGYPMDLATANLVVVQEPTSKKIDLMGDWYFRYYGASTNFRDAEIRSLLNNKEYLNNTPTADGKYWAVVQPTLGNWYNGFGNITGMRDWAIGGSGYYVREFTIDKNFDLSSNPVLTIGKVDDRCEAWINGVHVGATGMDANGDPTGETTWAVFSAYEVDKSILNVGGTNTVVVRAWNDTGIGYGGWNSGPVALYSGEQYASEFGDGWTKHFYEETFYSDAIGDDNEYLVYLPADYFETDRYYPTMYLLHQYNSDHTSYQSDKIDQLMDEAAEEGLFDEMIVVIPNSDVMSFWSGKWEDMIIDDLIPHIESKYRAIPDARYRMTAGCSMGGYGAFHVALRNPNYFSGLVSFFGAINMGNTQPINVLKDTSVDYMNYFSIAFICGNQDSYGFDAPAVELHKAYDEKGIDHYFFIENGGHDSAFYVPYFKDTVSYVRKNMYNQKGGSASSLIEVNYSANADMLSATFTADEAIRNYFLKIPVSTYTNDTNPGVTLPVVATIKYGNNQSTKVQFNVTFSDAEGLVVTKDIDLSNILPADAKVHSVKFGTQLLGNNKVEALKVNGNNLPQTGDNSNIALFASLLLISVAGMVVVSRKKAAC